MVEETLRALVGIEHADQRLDPETGSSSVRQTERVNPERPEAHDESVEPRRPTTPEDIARREQPDDSEGVDDDIAAERVQSGDRGDESARTAHEPSDQEEQR